MGKTVVSAVAALAVAAMAATLVTTASATPGPDHHAGHPTTSAPTISAPTIFGHRGAAGHRPEHTAASYELAAEMGADFLEPDLVPTRDGYLVDRHEPEISQTTDVADHPEFAHLKTTKTVDGVKTTGWFTTDFSLAQLQTLWAKERIPDIRQHNTMYNGHYRIPTLQQDIDQVRALSARLHRNIGIVPEIKHSTFFASVGLPMEQRTLDVLRRNHLDSGHSKTPVVIQSFEVTNLQWLHRHTDIALMQLTSASGAPADFVASGDPRTYGDLCSAAGLRSVIDKYATYLGPDKNQIIPRNKANQLLAPTSLVPDAHRVGLKVAPYTFRNENTFLPAELQNGNDPADYGDAITEYKVFFAAGVDGLFSDDSDTAVAARTEWIAQGRPRHA